MAHLWFQRVAGLGAELLPFALLPVRVLVVLPALEYALSVQRTHWILRRETPTVTIASGLEAAGLVLCMSLLIPIVKWHGTLSAAIALTLGRMAANGFLHGKRWKSSHRGGRQE